MGFGAKVHTCSRNETELNECLENWVGSGFGSVRAQREQLIGTLSSFFDNKLDILVRSHCFLFTHALIDYYNIYVCMHLLICP